MTVVSQFTLIYGILYMVLYIYGTIYKTLLRLSKKIGIVLSVTGSKLFLPLLEIVVEALVKNIACTRISTLTHN